MTPQAGKCFDGLTKLTDAHDSVQTLAGNATWVSKFHFMNFNLLIFAQIMYYTIQYISLFSTKSVASWKTEFQFLRVARSLHSFRPSSHSKISSHHIWVIRLSRAFPTSWRATYHWTKYVFLPSIQTCYGTYATYPTLENGV